MNILARLRIRTKLVILVVLSTVSLLAGLGVATSIQHDRMLQDRIGELRAVVDTAVSLAGSLEKQVAAGKLSRDDALARFRDVVHALWFDNGNGYLVVYRMDGVSLVNPLKPEEEGGNRIATTDVTGKAHVAAMIAVGRVGEGTDDYMLARPGQTEPQPKIAFVKAFRPWDMVVTAGLYVDDVEADYHRLALHLALYALAIVIVSSGVAYIVGRNIAVPLGRLKRTMARLAEGDFSAEIADDQRTDEVGEMAAAVRVFRINGLRSRDLEQAQAASKEQTAREHRQVMYNLAGAFDLTVGEIVESVATTSRDMVLAAQSLGATAEQTNRQCAAVAASTEETSQNVQTVASATEELSASIGEIGRQVERSTIMAREAVAQAGATGTTVDRLAQSAQRIGDVVKLIQGIASQTNLLALNATIEAARAGASGKGFAVVANEVKALANETARATEEIGSQIAEIQGATGQTVTAIKGIGATITEISEVAAAIAAAVNQQAAATQEIALSVQHAASGTGEISSNIGGVNAAAQETASSSVSVLNSAASLSGKAEQLRGEVRTFLNSLQAG
ncbi:MAG: methyl-accepting chemotaxis protein [Azospirillaceae bacterium]|nr:methyl-accepting chemotaxis protein [Azospirillaceae bacterium]